MTDNVLMGYKHTWHITVSRIISEFHTVLKIIRSKIKVK